MKTWSAVIYLVFKKFYILLRDVNIWSTSETAVGSCLMGYCNNEKIMIVVKAALEVISFPIKIYVVKVVKSIIGPVSQYKNYPNASHQAFFL